MAPVKVHRISTATDTDLLGLTPQSRGQEFECTIGELRQLFDTMEVSRRGSDLARGGRQQSLITFAGATGANVMYTQPSQTL